MNKDDTIYISLLLISIPIGFLLKKYVKNTKSKAFLSSLIGFLMVLIVCPFDVYHSLILSIINSLILVAVHPKYVAIFSFVWCFGYLFLFRTIYFFGLSKPVPYANAVQLILTLKCVGLAFEIHDSYNRKKQFYVLNESKNLNQKNSQEKLNNESNTENDEKLEQIKLNMEFRSIEPNFIHTILYSYCYIGILTGPYFKYRTYHDWLNETYSSDNIDVFCFMKKRGRIVPFIIIGFLILSKFVSFNDPLKENFYDSSLLYRILYMALIFTLFRFRFYIAWAFAELSCISAEFGVYPLISSPKPGAGPTKLKELKNLDKKLLKSADFSFDCINNIDEYKCETAKTVKDVMHYWNMTVQFWMANNVYKRVPLKKFGQPITMAVSAYWHGLHPGYYLSMLTTSPCILAENLMNKGLKKKYLNEKFYKVYDFATWFFRIREFDYMSIGFILLSYEETMKFWRSVYFIGHVISLSQSFLFSRPKDATNWNDLKVTWGINPFDSNNFQSLPRTVSEAVSRGWIKEKNCSQVNGNRYILNGDRAAILIFNARGIIAGIASYLPKGLPFNFPSEKIQPLFNDEGDGYTINAYFVDPESVCSAQLSAKQITGDRLIIKGQSKELNIPLEQTQLSNFWTPGKCFYTMGAHYWADIEGTELNESTNKDNFTPLFLLYNKGKLNGFGWSFNADLPSKRFEHPTEQNFGMFFKKVPKFLLDPAQSNIISTLHIYLDSTPQFNYC
ncbi:unnamed protein product [Brachionus calyciflorus]|uniref:Lysophospholipid acyltransferase 7 n=1 Tax=Brachionus calyciflorus TaxID=104777 RepID=A0A813XDX1_9BILA|nr:unnamed protein product [Brachionus calyciflorus]